MAGPCLWGIVETDESTPWAIEIIAILRPKVLIPLRMLDHIMSNPQIQDSQGLIAGEPAGENTYKNIPSLAKQRTNHNQQRSLPDEGKGKVKTKSKVFVLLQVISLILALSLSTYAILLSDSLQNKNNLVNDEAVEVLIRTEGRDADQICTQGGADIFIGNDINNNGILEEAEVTSTTRLCHGKEGFSGPQGATGPNGSNGSNGIQSLVETKEIEFGNVTCNYGGLLIQSGLDNNSNGELDLAEVIEQEALCDGQIGSNGSNGTIGAPALVEIKNPPAYLCSQGVILEFGVDDGKLDGIELDGILQPSEVRDTLKICSLPLASGPITDLFVGVSDGFNSACDSMEWIVSKEVLVSAGSDGHNGCELWSSKASLDSNSMLMDINPSGDSTPGLWLGMQTLYSNEQALLFFDADDGVNGRELWITDTTASGTQRITSLNGAGDGLSANSKISAWNDGMVFTNSENKFMWSNGSITTELFDAPFISSGMQSILDSSATEISVHSLTKLWINDDGLWFSAITASHDYEIHHLSNIGALTSWDINPLEGSMPESLVSEDGHHIVIADDGINGKQLYRLNMDSSHAKLTSLTLQSNGAQTTNVGAKMGLSKLGDVLVFDAQTSGVDTTLWSYNISSGVALELSSMILAPGERAGVVSDGSKIWFDCVTPTTANELCYTDGTIEGSKLAYEFQPGISSSDIRHIKLENQHILVIVDGQYNGDNLGHCLWSISTDTLQAKPVYDPWQGAGNNSQSGTYGELLNTEDVVFFIANDGLSGHEIHTWSPQEIGDEWLVWRITSFARCNQDTTLQFGSVEIIDLPTAMDFYKQSIA